MIRITNDHQGRVVMITTERDESGAFHDCEHLMPLSTWRELRDELDAAIKHAENVAWVRNL